MARNTTLLTINVESFAAYIVRVNDVYSRNDSGTMAEGNYKGFVSF